MNGWFAVPRGYLSQGPFVRHPERVALFVWLLENTLWRERPFDLNGTTVIVPRGSVVASQAQIAASAGIGRQVVRTFLKRLEADKLITRRETHGCTIISLCDYEKFQPGCDAANPQGNRPATQGQPAKEEGKKESSSFGGFAQVGVKGGQRRRPGRQPADPASGDRFGAFGRIPEVP